MRRARLVSVAACGLLAAACTARDSSDAAGRPVPAPCSPLADPAATITYEAVTPDGHYVVFLAGPGSTSRVFYGTRDHLVEGRITDSQQGCAESIGFSVEGRSYGAVFAYPSCGSVVTSRLSAGEVGGPIVTQPLEVLVGVPPGDGGALAPAPPSSSLAFYCL
jgi:hypothetical protein